MSILDDVQKGKRRDIKVVGSEQETRSSGPAENLFVNIGEENST